MQFCNELNLANFVLVKFSMFVNVIVGHNTIMLLNRMWCGMSKHHLLMALDTTCYTVVLVWVSCLYSLVGRKGDGIYTELQGGPNNWTTFKSL